jgi:dCTP deaminase
MLSDADIKHELAKEGGLVITPLDPSDIQPASVDVHLSDIIMEFAPQTDYYLDPRKIPENLMHSVLFNDPFDIDDIPAFVLGPRQFVLGSLQEWVEVPNYLSCRIEGKSSLGRLGLGIHVTAGFVDPGWKGRLTIEIFNFGPKALILVPGMPIAQLAFDQLRTPSDHPYGHQDRKSKYQGDEGPQGSRGI